jgi:histidinol dehydrogenase
VPHQLDQILISCKQHDFKDRFTEMRAAVLRATHFDEGSEQDQQVGRILNEVGTRGDEAVAEYTEEFDRVKLRPGEFRVPSAELERAHNNLDSNLLGSIRQAIDNVRQYQSDVFIGNNKHPGLRYTSIRRIGVCVPGASAPLPSTVIMTVVPAQVAGVKEIAVVSPPRYKASIHPTTLAVCCELGIEEVYRIGGVQAVMALAMGTRSVPNVDKIVGPGNQWVQMAKKKVLGLVGIDSIAGPSEVLIIADERANPAWVAADMLSQAEHGPGSAVVFTDSQQLAQKILDELKQQIKEIGRSKETAQCLEEFGGIVVFDNMADVIDWANLFAAEHLEVQCGHKSRDVAEKIENAGAIFIGDYSPVAVGDYWAGPSHTLPSGASARFFSALSANDFIKSTSIIEYDKPKLAECADHIIRLAEVEGLDAHAKSIRIRQQS